MSAERPTSTFREYLEALLIAGIFLGFVNSFLVKTFYIPSASMEETLLVGDHLFVNRFIYGPQRWSWEKRLLPGRDLRRGDVVVFRSPEDPAVDMVKRCVGLPGDTVQVIDKELYLNGAWVNDSSYAVHRDPRLYSTRAVLAPSYRVRDNFGPYEVPPDHYFCMGDNRDLSYDSRFWGPLPRQLVKGRAVLIYWSYGGETSDGNWHGWGVKIRQLLGTVLGFFTKTRWSRSLHLVR